jgi:hypothetical protein
MNFAQQFNEAFQKKLSETSFPVESISEQWKRMAQQALFFVSIIKLGIDPADLQRLFLTLRKGGPLSMLDFSILSNNLQARTPFELELGLSEYIEFMKGADELVKVWQEIAQPMREVVEKELQEELQKKAAEKGIAKHPGIMNPIKGEA